MQVPESFYGSYSDVNKATKQVITQIRKGKQLYEAFGDTYLKTEDYNCKLYLDQPAIIRKERQDFHFYLFIRNVILQLHNNKISEEQLDDIFYELLKTSWGLLSLMAGCMDLHQRLYRKNERYIPFLLATLQFWEEYMEIGEAFPHFMKPYGTLWEVNSNLGKVLVRSGIPNEVLNAPLPDNDLKALLVKYRIL